MLKNTVGKAVPLNKLAGALDKEYFALKSGTLYWSDNQRSRKVNGKLVVKDIEAIDINPKNPMEIVLLC